MTARCLKRRDTASERAANLLHNLVVYARKRTPLQQRTFVLVSTDDTFEQELIPGIVLSAGERAFFDVEVRYANMPSAVRTLGDNS